MSVTFFRDVTKRFRHTVALNGLHFEVAGSRLTALLGPNGAGKTTAFRSILGLCRPDEGQISVMDCRVGPDTSRVVKNIGWVSESGQGLYDHLTAVDNMKGAAAALVRRQEPIRDLLDLVGLRGASQAGQGLLQRNETTFGAGRRVDRRPPPFCCWMSLWMDSTPQDR